MGKVNKDRGESPKRRQNPPRQCRKSAESEGAVTECVLKSFGYTLINRNASHVAACSEVVTIEDESATETASDEVGKNVCNHSYTTLKITAIVIYPTQSMHK
jgi:hypothetical protein